MTDKKKDEQIMGWIATLALSQGMYGRLFRTISEADDYCKEEFFSQFRKCESLLDFIMAFEC